MRQAITPGPGMGGAHAFDPVGWPAQVATVPHQDFINRTALPVVTLMLVCFVQIGGYSVFSVNFVAFLLTMYFVGTRHLLHGTAIALACAPLTFASLFPFLSEPEILSAIVRQARELAVLAVIVAAAVFSERRDADCRRLDLFIVGCLGLMMLYAALQFFSLHVLGEPQFFMNWRLYGGISGVEGEGGYRLTTLPSYWAEFGAANGLDLGASLRIRASAFYSEPSYLGFVVLGLIFALTSGSPWRRVHALAIGMGLLSTLLAQSASGSILLLMYLAARYRKMLWNYLPALVVTAVPAGLYLMADAVARLASISDSSEELSGFIRLIKPLENIA